MRRADARVDEPKIECDRKATFGGRPKRRTSAAAISAMSASSSALGSSLTKVSAMNSVCLSSVSAFIAAAVRTPGFSAHLSGFAGIGTFKNDVLHLAAAQSFRALFAQHPADRVGDVRFAATVRTDDGSDTRLETERGRISEGFETVQL